VASCAALWRPARPCGVLRGPQILRETKAHCFNPKEKTKVLDKARLYIKLGFDVHGYETDYRLMVLSLRKFGGPNRLQRRRREAQNTKKGDPSAKTNSYFTKKRVAPSCSISSISSCLTSYCFYTNFAV
jgi:hypothetical protein